MTSHPANGAISFESLLEKMEAIQTKLKDAGIKIDKNRYGKHHKLIEQLVNSFKNDTHDDFVKKFKHEESITAFTETVELISIVNNIPLTHKDRKLNKKIQLALNGALLPSQENCNSGNTQARNTLFELLLGASLYKGHHNIDFSVEDFQISDGEDTYIVECKRPFKKETVLSNFEKAINQLNSKTIEKARTFGIVAISINRVLTNGQLFLEAKNEEALAKRLSFENNNFIEKWFMQFNKIVINTRILGVIIHLSVPAKVESTKTIYNSEFFTTKSFCIEGSSDFIRLTEFVSKLKPLL
jgi:hypothetical protein